MLNSFPFSVIVGGVLGFLAGLGVGGGTLLLLWLTLILGIDPITARGINLLFFLPTALISSLFRHRSGILKIKPLLPAMVTGCVGAWIFSKIALTLNPKPLKIVFGILLILTGIRELFYRRRNAK